MQKPVQQNESLNWKILFLLVTENQNAGETSVGAIRGPPNNPSNSATNSSSVDFDIISAQIDHLNNTVSNFIYFACISTAS